MARGTLTVTFKADGVRETLKAFNELGKPANAELRDASLQIADWAAMSIKAAASTPMQRALAPSVKATRDRVPAVFVGGGGRVGSHRAKAWDLVFGAEFGGGVRRRSVRQPVFGKGAHRNFLRHTTRQFGPHAGRDGKWFFRWWNNHDDEVYRRWQDAVDQLLAKWGGTQ